MKIEILFPEICNLYGDLANIRYIKESVPEAQIIETSLKEKPFFADNDVDLIYMGTTTEQGITLSVNALLPYVSKLKELIDAGQFILLTGNALDIFGKYIDSDSKEHIEGLGIIPTHAEYYMLKRQNCFCLGEFSDEDARFPIVGFKSIFGYTYPEKDNSQIDNSDESQKDSNESSEAVSKFSPLFIMERGAGRNTLVKEDGFRFKNLLATHLIGPLLPLNPYFTKWLLTKLGAQTEPAFFESALKAFEVRKQEMENQHFDPMY